MSTASLFIRLDYVEKCFSGQLQNRNFNPPTKAEIWSLNTYLAGYLRSLLHPYTAVTISNHNEIKIHYIIQTTLQYSLEVVHMYMDSSQPRFVCTLAIPYCIAKYNCIAIVHKVYYRTAMSSYKIKS